MEIVEKNRRHVTEVRDEVRRPALCPVLLLHYAIARQGRDGPRLLCVPLGFDEEALILFSARGAAQRYCLARRRFLSEVFNEEWYARECSPGELVSLLLGPYEGIGWMLVDPPPGERIVVGSTQADLISRERFIDYLLDQPAPTFQRH